jgi:hypothetical protein
MLRPACMGWGLAAAPGAAGPVVRVAAGHVQISVDATPAALGRSRWELILAEDRPWAIAGTGVEAVVCA